MICRISKKPSFVEMCFLVIASVIFPGDGESILAVDNHHTLIAESTNQEEDAVASQQDGKEESQSLEAKGDPAKKPVKANAELWCQYVGEKGVGAGKHIVLIAGDDEYRSEEALPMLGRILAKHHGFKCTVLFPVEPKSKTIKPDHQTNIPGMHLIADADLLILGLRFRNLPDESMKFFAEYVDSGKPIIGIRTSTHAFNFPKDSKSQFKQYGYNNREWRGGFGQQVLGDTWINHHGDHKVESTRGVINEKLAENPILKGVSDVWGPTDVYGIRNLPAEASVLLYGQVLKGMKPTDEPVAGKKNSPMMPLAWVRDYPSKSGNVARIFCTTMGSSTDFECEDLRRLIVNASFWCLSMEKMIPAKADVSIVGEYNPTPFGFGNYRKGMKPSDFALPAPKK